MFNLKNKLVPTLPYRNKAFTLAEVLITLVIIGVIAAITVPILINKYQEHVTITKVKKFYKTMGSALNLAIHEHGTVDKWDYDISNQVLPYKLVNYFRPHLSIMKDCTNTMECFSKSYSKLNGSNYGQYYEVFYHKLILNDGSTVIFRGDDTPNASVHCNHDEDGWHKVCGVIFIDINGDNPPNVIGKDFFAFDILKDRLVPANSNTCKRNSSGWGCSQFILKYNNMNYPSS